MFQNKITIRIVGFVASLLLTFAAYFVIISPEFLNIQNKTAVYYIITLAIIQSIVQLLCFIDIWGEKGPPWNLGVFVSTISIILIIIIFSIWIMNHLNYNMMP